MSRFLKIYHLFLIAALWIFSGCSVKDIPLVESSENKINVDGIDRGELVVETRSQSVDAEDVSWLMPSLKAGINIRYGLYGAQDPDESVAVLKFIEEHYDAVNKLPKPAAYSFKYLGTDNDALWKNNGLHYFRGVYVPERIRYATNPEEIDAPTKAPSLVSDQHDDKAVDVETVEKNGNYTLLSRYLSMPANYRLTATIMRIKLPFRHRLSRVVAFVLIDPELKTTLKGYTPTVKDASGNITAKDDPTTTSIRFCNVKVLRGVHNYTIADNHYLTPTWTTARTIIPHFDGERGSYSYKDGVEKITSGDKVGHFLYYYKEGDGKRLESYPSSDNWTAIHNATNHNGYTEVDYGPVPVYDVIVRPTYTSVDNVMPEEQGYPGTATALAAEKNQIDFEMELANGLRYQKRFEFDLDANYQTVVYLRISREHVDYNDAGSDMWVEEKNVRDGWYGVDNQNGNTLSFAGSSWQRAYTYLSSDSFNENNYPEGVTDGSFYNASTVPSENEHAQYFTPTYQAMWVERFLAAYKGGAHHGDYFALRTNISIDARLIPQDFVFTGHLDAQDYTITLTNTGMPVYKAAVNIKDQLYTKLGSTYNEWTIPTTLYVKHVTPATYWQESELTQVDGKKYVTTTLIYHPEIPEEWHAATEEDVEQGRAENVGDKVIDVAHQDAYYEVTGESIEHYPGDVKTPEVITYPQATNETVPPYPTTLSQLTDNEYYIDQNGTRFVCPVLYQFSHNSASYLFEGLNGTYTTPQESNPSLPANQWQANVHKETNVSAIWVPTAGYRAELLNVKIASPAKLFKDGAEISGNVQNCWNGSTAVTNNTPDIPQYK